MRAPLLLDLPQSPRRPQDTGDAAPEEVGYHESHEQARLAVYASAHSRSGRPRFIGPAPRPGWRERIRMRLRRMLGKETGP